MLALVVLVYGALVLRSQSRTSTQGQALVRLGVGLALLPLIWALTLVAFLDVEVSRLGPGPWVTTAGGCWPGWAPGVSWRPRRRRRRSPGRAGRC